MLYNYDMKRGKARTNVLCKARTHKSLTRRVKVTAYGGLIHRNRMRKHLMLRRKVCRQRNCLMVGSEFKMIRKSLGLPVSNSSRSMK